jgi:hypothetical protein
MLAKSESSVVRYMSGVARRLITFFCLCKVPAGGMSAKCPLFHSDLGAKSNQRKSHPAAALSCTCIADLGRLAQLDQTSEAQHSLVLGLEQCASLILNPLTSSARQRGRKSKANHTKFQRSKLKPTPSLRATRSNPVFIINLHWIAAGFALAITVL